MKSQSAPNAAPHGDPLPRPAQGGSETKSLLQRVREDDQIIFSRAQPSRQRPPALREIRRGAFLANALMHVRGVSKDRHRRFRHEHVHRVIRESERTHQRRGEQDVAEMIQPNDYSFQRASMTREVPSIFLSAAKAGSIS